MFRSLIAIALSMALIVPVDAQTCHARGAGNCVRPVIVQPPVVLGTPFGFGGYGYARGLGYGGYGAMPLGAYGAAPLGACDPSALGAGAYGDAYGAGGVVDPSGFLGIFAGVLPLLQQYLYGGNGFGATAVVDTGVTCHHHARGSGTGTCKPPVTPPTTTTATARAAASTAKSSTISKSIVSTVPKAAASSVSTASKGASIGRTIASAAPHVAGAFAKTHPAGWAAHGAGLALKAFSGARRR